VKKLCNRISNLPFNVNQRSDEHKVVGDSWDAFTKRVLVAKHIRDVKDRMHQRWSKLDRRST